MDKKIKTVKPRKLARMMARKRLEKAGASGYNKRPTVLGKVMDSRFARNWKELAAQAQADALAREEILRKEREER